MAIVGTTVHTGICRGTTFTLYSKSTKGSVVFYSSVSFALKGFYYRIAVDTKPN